MGIMRNKCTCGSGRDAGGCGHDRDERPALRTKHLKRGEETPIKEPMHWGRGKRTDAEKVKPQKWGR